MTVLVTGATGFIGTAVVRRLLAAGQDVRGVSRAGGEGALSIDLRDREASLRTLGPIRFEAIVHLAAELPASASVEDMQRSFDGTVAIDSTIFALTLPRRCPIVYASGTSVYAAFGGLLDESTPPEPQHLYAAAKLVGEILYGHYARSTGAPAALLRISAPYGPGMRRPTVVESFLRQARASEDIVLQGSGSRTQDFTYVEDAAEAILAALERKASGVYNIGTGGSISMRDLAEAAIAAAPGSSSHVVRRGDDPQEHHRMLLDVRKAAGSLGWSARTPLERGLQAMQEYT
jgi:UDP-glucose 4-epimerase